MKINSENTEPAPNRSSSTRRGKASTRKAANTQQAVNNAIISEELSWAKGLQKSDTHSAVFAPCLDVAG